MSDKKRKPQPAQSPASATAAFVDKFNDDSQWNIVRGVPVFDEHTEEYEEPVLGPDGKPQKDQATGKPMRQKKADVFDVARLQAHADNCNKLVASGNPPGLVLGHTKDEADERTQPETVGWAKNFRVEYSPLLTRNVIVQDEYYKPDRFEEVRTFPFRSVERWKGGQYFKPIALLRREPRRNLGIVSYRSSSGDQVTRYSMEYAKMDMPPQQPPAAAPPAAPPMPPATPQMNAAPPAAAPAPPMPAAPAGPDPGDIQKLLALLADPAVKAAVAQCAGPAAAPPAAEPPAAAAPPSPEAPPMGDKPKEKKEPEKNAAGMGMPSGSNTCPPKMEPAKMSADTQEVVRYQKEVEELRGKVAKLETSEKLARYSADIAALAREVVVNDPADELHFCQEMTQPQFEAYLQRCRTNYAKLPAGEMVRSADLEEPVMGRTKKGVPQSRDDIDAILKYQADHPGTPYHAAQEKVLGAA